MDLREHVDDPNYAYVPSMPKMLMDRRVEMIRRASYYSLKSIYVLDATSIDVFDLELVVAEHCSMGEWEAEEYMPCDPVEND